MFPYPTKWLRLFSVTALDLRRALSYFPCSSLQPKLTQIQSLLTPFIFKFLIDCNQIQNWFPPHLSNHQDVSNSTATIGRRQTHYLCIDFQEINTTYYSLHLAFRDSEIFVILWESIRKGLHLTFSSHIYFSAFQLGFHLGVIRAIYRTAKMLLHSGISSSPRPLTMINRSPQIIYQKSLPHGKLHHLFG